MPLQSGTIFAAENTSVPRPNIVLILADDLGYSDLGCYGGEIKTPNLDSLAAGGIRFKQFYNNTRCCPTRAALNTGLYPHQAGMGGMDGYAPHIRGYEGFLTNRCVTTAEVLKASGYRTYMVGKWHMNVQSGPIMRGFDEFYGLHRGHSASFFNRDAYERLPEGRPTREYQPDKFYSTDAFTDYALDFLAESRKPDADGKRPPFFLYIAHTAPHFPLHAPKEEIDKYADTYLKGWDVLREERYARQRALGVIDEHIPLTPRSYVPKNGSSEKSGWVDKENPAWDSIDADRRDDLVRRMAIFAAMVDRMDQNIGRVIDDLKKNGDLDNTLILFLSDNGANAEWMPWGFEDHPPHTDETLEKMGLVGTYLSTGSGWATASNTPFRLYKHYVHEGGTRTPMIAHWPKGIARKGEFEPSVGHIIDFMPTFIELAGAAYPTERNGKPILSMEGRSLVPAFQGKPDTPRTLAWEHEDNRGIREGDMKLVWVNYRRTWELYDLSTDPVEMNDLAAQQPETVTKMSEAWAEWARRTFVINDPRPARTVFNVDKTPGLKLALDFTKDEPIADVSGKENLLIVEGTLPLVEGGRKFNGESFVDIPHSDSLHCAQTAWTVEATLTPEKKDGIIVACGGNQVGYTLALQNGRPVFAVRSGAVQVLTGEKAIPSGQVTLRGVLDEKRQMTLYVNGEEVATKVVPSLIGRLPNEGTQIGADAGTQVLPSPLPGFQGVIGSVKIFRGVP